MLEFSQLLIEPFRELAPALYLDRDGVVIEDCHHIMDPDKVRLCPGARHLIEASNDLEVPVILVTNQSGISRGLFQWSHFEIVNQRMQELLGANAPISAIYANGYGPDSTLSSWRKPGPQMLLESAEALNLDLQRSMIIGDRLTDLQAGAAANVAFLFHVLSGHGSSARKSVVEWHLKSVNTSKHLKQSTHELSRVNFLDTLHDFPIQILKQSKVISR